MSIDATRATWLLRKEVTAIQKLLLLSLADRAGENGECWPSLRRIQEDTGLDRKTIIENRQHLINNGLISYTGNFAGKQKQIPIMRLNYITPRESETNPDFDEYFTSTENGSGQNFTDTENGTGESFTSTENGTGDQYRKRDTEPKRYEPKKSVCVGNDLKPPKTHTPDNSQIQIQTPKPNPLTDATCQQQFKKRFGNKDLTIEQLYMLAVEKIGRGEELGVGRFLDFILTQHTHRYPDKSKPTASSPEAQATPFTPEELKNIQDYSHAIKFKSEKMLKSFFKDETALNNAVALFSRYEIWRKEDLAALGDLKLISGAEVKI